MWLDQVNELSDVFRVSLPYCIAFLLPLMIILSPVDTATEFPVYRLQHFDLQGIRYGLHDIYDDLIEFEIIRSRCKSIIVHKRFQEFCNEF